MASSNTSVRPWVKSKDNNPFCFTACTLFFQSSLTKMNSIILPSLLRRSSSQYPHFTVGKTGTPGQSDLPQGTLSQWRHSSLLGRQHPNKATDEKMLGAANFQKGYVTSSINFMGFCEDNYLLKEFKKTTSPHQFCLLISFFLYLLLFSYLHLS